MDRYQNSALPITNGSAVKSCRMKELVAGVANIRRSQFKTDGTPELGKR